MNQGEENSEETAFVVDEVSNIIKEVRVNTNFEMVD
jgi:hypothetical protein